MVLAGPSSRALSNLHPAQALKLRRRALVTWGDQGTPQRVLLVKKPGVPEASARLVDIALFLAARGIQAGGRGRAGEPKAAQAIWLGIPLHEAARMAIELCAGLHRALAASHGSPGDLCPPLTLGPPPYLCPEWVLRCHS
jgi:hypothetical protein